MHQTGWQTVKVTNRIRVKKVVPFYWIPLSICDCNVRTDAYFIMTFLIVPSVWRMMLMPLCGMSLILNEVDFEE